MSAEIKKITADEIYAVSMRRLADRPNSASANGRGALSSAELKGYMDKFPKLIAGRLNHLIDLINAGSGEGILSILKTPVVDEKTQKEITLLEWIDLVIEEYTEIQNEIVKKLDKVSGTTSKQQVYVKNTDGNQQMVNLTREFSENTIMKRDSAGRSQVGSPSESYDAANKYYVDNKVNDIKKLNQDELNSKVKKFTDVVGYSRAYVNGKDGIDSGVRISPDLIGSTIVLRDENGRASFSDPSADSNAATKRYVDTEANKRISKSGGTITGDLIIGGNLTVKGENTVVDSTTLKVADKLIEVAKNNSAPLTSPAGIVVPKYDGVNDGALVFDSNGIAYVGDVFYNPDTGEIEPESNPDMQAIATRVELNENCRVRWDPVLQALTYGEEITSDHVAFTIPVRDENGTFKVDPPSGDYDCANKKYVDTAITSAITTTLNTAV